MQNFDRLSRAALLTAAGFIFSSCGGGGGSGITPNFSKPPNSSSGGGSQAQQPGAVSSTTLLYVVNRAEFNSFGASVTAYPTSANGNVAPTLTLTGSNTGIGNPIGDAFDSHGNLYVTTGGAGCGTPCIRIFAPGATGNVAPFGAICGAAADITGQSSIAIDAANTIYMVNFEFFGGQDINVYKAGTTTSVPPEFVLTPTDNTDIAGVAASTNLYVLHSEGPVPDLGHIDVYPPGASGNPMPIATIEGDKTGLVLPDAIALDSSGKIYVLNPGFGATTLTIYPAGSNGNVAPIATIGGSKTKFLAPEGLAVDAAGVMYVGNADNKILEFAPGSNGNVAPIRIIAGKNTGLVQPVALALH